MEWLYSGPASSVDREEYLLGKKIDRQVDPTLAENAREKEVRVGCNCGMLVVTVAMATYLHCQVCEHVSTSVCRCWGVHGLCTSN